MFTQAFNLDGTEVWLQATSLSEGIDLTAVTATQLKHPMVRLSFYWLTPTQVVIEVEKFWGIKQVEAFSIEFGTMDYGDNKFNDSEREFRQLSIEPQRVAKRCRLYIWQLAIQWCINGNWLRRVHYRISNRSNDAYRFVGTKQDTVLFVKHLQDSSFDRLFSVGKFPHEDDYSALTKSELDTNFSFNFYMSCVFEVLLDRLTKNSDVLLSMSIQLSDEVCQKIWASSESPVNYLRGKFKSLGLNGAELTSGFLFVIEDSSKRNKAAGLVNLKINDFRYMHVHIVGVFNLQVFNLLEMPKKLKDISTMDNRSVNVKSEDGVKLIDPIYTIADDDRLVTREQLIERCPITMGKVDYLSKGISKPLKEGSSNWGTVRLAKDLCKIKKRKYKQQVRLNTEARKLEKNFAAVEEEPMLAQLKSIVELK